VTPGRRLDVEYLRRKDVSKKRLPSFLSSITVGCACAKETGNKFFLDFVKWRCLMTLVSKTSGLIVKQHKLVSDRSHKSTYTRGAIERFYLWLGQHWLTARLLGQCALTLKCFFSLISYVIEQPLRILRENY
jgi:hypothetical protein